MVVQQTRQSVSGSGRGGRHGAARDYLLLLIQPVFTGTGTLLCTPAPYPPPHLRTSPPRVAANMDGRGAEATGRTNTLAAGTGTKIGSPQTQQNYSALTVA